MKDFLPGFLLPGKKAGLREWHRNNIQTGNYRVVLAATLFLLILGMYMSQTFKRSGFVVHNIPVVDIGDIYPRREIALFDFKVPKSSETLEQERKRAVESVLPVFTMDKTVHSSVNSDLDAVLSVLTSAGEETDFEDVLGFANLKPGVLSPVQAELLSSSLKSAENAPNDIGAALKAEFAKLYAFPVVRSKEDVAKVADGMLQVEEGDSRRVLALEKVLTLDEAGVMIRSRIDNLFSNQLSRESVSALKSMAASLIKPNTVYNELKNIESLRHAINSVPDYTLSYKKNERIIEANVPVTETHLTALEVYREEIRLKSFRENKVKYFVIALGQTIVAAGLVVILLGAIYLYRRRIYDSIGNLLLLSILGFIPVFMAFYIGISDNLSELLVPVAASAILASILFDSEVAILFSMIISSLVVTLLPDAGISLGIIYSIAGGVGALTVGKVRHRKQFYRSMVFVPLSMMLAVVFLNDWLLADLSFVGTDISMSIVNGLFCPIIAIGLLPIFETAFKITTDITLLEISDLNNKLLKELAVNAPGTFSASLVVGTLAEAAAERIGANSLLARTGAYYHDIGKATIPEYFIENQIGYQNPHDKISPNMSALILASHVKEGYELGKKHHLPEAILDIIKQHHGTSLMASFYQKAIETENGSVDETKFRYSGPKPQTREAGIVMLADLSEAASRSISDRSPAKLKNLINKIVEQRFIEGELDECDLTLRDLHMIQESFLPILAASHHDRPKYPWQNGQNGKSAKNRTEKNNVTKRSGTHTPVQEKNE